MKFIGKIFFAAVFTISFAANAQTESGKDSVNIHFSKPEQIIQNSNVAEPENAYPSKLFVPEIKNSIPKISNYNFTMPRYDYGLEAHITRTTPNPLAVKTPMSADFYHSGVMPLSANSFLTASQNRQTYMLIGTKENLGGAYNFATERLFFSTGISVDKYIGIGNKSTFDANINMQLQYLISDRITLSAFASHYFDKNKDFISAGMFASRPQTYYGGNLNFAVTERFYIQGGAYGANDSVFGNRQNDYGFNADVGLWLTDRVKVAGMGQYSVRNGRGQMSQGMGMYPQTYYGGYIEFKVTEDFGVRGGAKREFDVRKQKWVTTPYFEFVSYK
jgi:hypothetical protein